MIDEVVRFGGTEITLDPLRSTGATELAADLLEGRPGPRLVTAIEGANGNPLFVTELLRGAIEEDLLVSDVDASGTVVLDAVGLPTSLQRLVERRVQRLDSDAIDLLRRAALLGSTFRLDHLAVVAGAARISDLEPLIRQAKSHGIIHDEDDGDGVGFQHDLVRDAVYDAISAQTRAEWHRDAAISLLAADAVDLVIARQLLLAGAGAVQDLGDTAIDLLRRAAGEVVDGAPATADRFLTLVLGVLAADDERRPRLVADLGRARFWAGDLVGSDKVIADELGHDHPHDLLVDLRGVRAEILFVVGRLDKAVEAFDELARSLATAKAGHRLSEAATSCLLSGRLDRAETLAAEALHLSLERESLAGACEARNTLGWVQCLRGDLDGGLETVTASVEAAEAAQHPDGDRTIPWLFLGQALSWSDRSAASISAYAQARLKAADLGVGWYDPLVAAALSGELLACGAWDDALAEAESIIAYSRDTSAEMTDAWAYAAIAQVARRRGADDAAQAALEAGRRLGEAGVAQGRDIITAEQARFQAASDPAGAADLLLLWDILDGYGIALRMWEIAPDLVELLLAVDRRDDALRVFGRLEGLAGRDVGVTRVVNHARCALQLGRSPDDLHDVDELAERTARSQRPIVRAELWSTTAVAIAAARPDDARRYGVLAADVFETVGATADIDRMAIELQTAGVTLTRRDPAPVDGWDRVTPSEHRVIALVAEGLTNGEIAERCSCRVARSKVISTTCTPSSASDRAPSSPSLRTATPSAERPDDHPPMRSKTARVIADGSASNSSFSMRSHSRAAWAAVARFPPSSSASTSRR